MSDTYDLNEFTRDAVRHRDTWLKAVRRRLFRADAQLKAEQAYRTGIRGDAAKLVDAALAEVRASHKQTLRELHTTEVGAERARHEAASLRSSLKDLGRDYDERGRLLDQAKHDLAELEGRAATQVAPEPPATTPAPAKPRNAPARGAKGAQATADPPAHTPVTPKPRAGRTGRPGAAK